MKRLILFIALATLADAAPTAATESISLQGPLTYEASALWSGLLEVTLNDSLALIGMSNGMRIVDISTPDSPVVVNDIYLPGGYVTGITVAGTRAVVTVWDGIVYVIDITNPATAERQESWSFTTPANAYAVAARDTLAFVTYGVVNGPQGLSVLNISDPSSIQEIGSLSPLEETPVAVALAGDYLYMAGAYVWSVNISNPAFPVRADRIFTGYYALDLDIRDSQLLVANLDVMTPPVTSAVTCINVTDSGTLDTISTLTLSGSVDDVKFGPGNIAVVCNGPYLRTVDVADPASPAVIGTWPVAGFAGKLAVKDSLVFLADYAEDTGFKKAAAVPGDLQIVSVADPASLQLAGRLPVAANVLNVTCRDSLVFALNSTGIGVGIQVVQVSDGYIDTISTLAAAGEPKAAVVFDDTLLLVAGSAGLEVVNISDSTSLQSVRLYASAAGALDVLVVGRFAVVAGTLGIYAYDLDDPTDTPASVFATQGAACAEMRVYGNRIYAAAMGYHCQIHSIENILNPQYVTTISSYIVNALDTYDGSLYLKTTWGFQSYALGSDPDSPTLLGIYEADSWNYDLLATDRFVVIADGWDGVTVCDVTDPANPTVVSRYNTPGFAWNLATTGDRIVVADRFSVITLKSDLATDIPEQANPLPDGFALHQNYPNPFNPVTEISYELSHRSRVSLEVYNILGRRVATLVNRNQPAGRHRVTFDASGLASGLYLYRLTASGHAVTRKMLLMK